MSDTIGSIFTVGVAVLKVLRKWTNPISRISAAAAAVLAFFKLFEDGWAAIFEKLDDLVVPALGGSVDFAPLSLANYFLPIDLVCTHLAIFCVLKLACAIIRIIKSFVPTVS